METLIAALPAAGGWIAVGVAVFLLASVFRGARRTAGTEAGRTSILHSPVYYVVTLAIDILIGILLWIRLPGAPFPPEISLAGFLILTAGLGIVLWSRLTLGKMYFVSTMLGAQLFAGHRLVTSGPYAVVRHPLYSGFFVAATGGVLLWQTWTAVFFLAIGLVFLARAVREERALANQFGAEWEEYRRRTPMFLPRLFPRRAAPGGGAGGR
jgi:protein-S-isoprenylcysteine O-methyltransferase Ste14